MARLAPQARRSAIGAPLDTITVILLMLVGVVLSGTLSRLVPVIPLPLVQIAFGALVAASTSVSIRLEPDIFFLLFLPPLLFLDGWRIPKERLFRDKWTVLELAIGLVVFTILGVGFFIWWLIPAMPLAVAFALAAILSPTDPIAVTSIASRTPIPERMLHILEGESLLNDASGLTAMRFAVAAALTGSFSLWQASATFLWLALGGIAVGAGLTIAVTWLRGRAARKIGDEAGSDIVVSLLIPFGAYLLAEHLGSSGILAAVAAGFVMSYADLYQPMMAGTRIRRTAVWDTVQFAANGAIFTLLGAQLPPLVDHSHIVAAEIGLDQPLWLVAYAVAIMLVLAAMRFVWVAVTLHVNLIGARKRGEPKVKSPWRLVTAMSLAGVRGAITLAGILTLPFVMNDGSPFPTRDLAILLAALVIILSLAVASIGLPMVMNGLELPPRHRDQHEDEARAAAAEAAMRAVDERQHEMIEAGGDPDLYEEVGSHLIALYRERAAGRDGEDEDHAAHAAKRLRIRRALGLAALASERKTIMRFRRHRQIEDVTAQKLLREVDLMEARFSE